VSADRQIIVSTHFDDAALSLAHLLATAGPLATVVTVCGGPPPEGLPVSGWDAGCGFESGPAAARARATEDRAACAVTGASPRPLDHPDSPYAPMPDPAIVRAEIEPLLTPGCVLWLPAGIGNPDHAHVRDALWLIALALPEEEVRVYVDLPYAAELDLPGAREERLTDAAFARKLEAVRCHASQMPALQRTWPDLLERDGPLARERTFGQLALAEGATWPAELG